MIIIGDAGTEVIVSATREELAHIAGFFNQYSQGISGTLVVGQTIEVNAIYTKVKAIADAGGKLISVQSTLRAVADVLDPIVPVITS